MGIRDRIDKHKGVSIAVVFGVAAVVLGTAVYSTRSGGVPQAAGAGQAWFTDDDGKTLFADDAMKQPPFEHNGKQAVRAYCFTTDGGKTHWVGYLERYSAAGKKAIDAYDHQPIKDPDPVERGRVVAMATEVKPPGAAEGEWTSRREGKKYDAITAVKAPAGQGAGAVEPYMP